MNPSSSDFSRITRCTSPIAQESSATNLGYGHIYYALTRLTRARHALVIGSGHGFTPAIIAKAMDHNGSGRVTFVDPSMSIARDGANIAHGGSGQWNTPEMVRARFVDCVGTQRITHHKMTNRQFFSHWRERPDLVVIDGAHDYENARYDLAQSVKRMKIPGYILLHDSTNFWNLSGHMGVSKLVKQLRDTDVELMTFPGRAGLTLLRVTRTLDPVQALPGGRSLVGLSVAGVALLGLGVLVGRL